jgi:uncharacterized peroxidase-related enzyme
MSWIKEISYEEADSYLKKLYDRVKGPNDNVDNILMAQSLRPHTLIGHMGLYKNVLHHTRNSFPKWYLETVGVFVSHLNGCDYCVEHHFTGLKKLLNNDEKAVHIKQSLVSGLSNCPVEKKHIEGLKYAKKLTLTPVEMKEEDLQKLRSEGLSDGEILEINQVTSYFNYANRTVLGLGVNTKGDILGLSPNVSDDTSNWSHT